MNNIKISQLDENLSPSYSSVTVVVENDIAKKSTIQSIKNTLFTGDSTITGDLTVTDNTYLKSPLSVTGDTTIKGDITVTDNTYLKGDLFVTGDTQSIYNWTLNDTKWSIVECQGHNTVSITGDTGIGQIWFPFSGLPMTTTDFSNFNENHLRGGVVSYFAVCNGGCNTLQTGTVHFVRDRNAEVTENRVSFGCDLYFGEGGNGSRGGLKVYSNNASEMDIVVQWTAKLFYAEEWFC